MYQYQQFAILLRGGGDIATGIALRLYRSGFRRLIILETAHPMAVRRRVAFSEAVYEGLCTVEGITAALAPRPEEIAPLWDAGCIPVMVDPQGVTIPASAPKSSLSHARQTERRRRHHRRASRHRRGARLHRGRKCPLHRRNQPGAQPRTGPYSGSAEPDTGIPGDIVGMTTERVLRAPRTGIFLSRHDIGTTSKAGDVVATVEANGVSREIRTVISGVIRGLLRSGTPVTDRIKVGDVDPRDNTACHHVSDKAFAIGGGILEAILGRFNRPCYIRRGILHCPVDKNVPTA
ncbi:MAG: molybdenum hydroxylase [Bilophila wadsworthia]